MSSRAVTGLSVISRAVLAILLVAGISGSRQRADAASQARGVKAPPLTFRFDVAWPKLLPNNWLLGNVSGVAVDAKDHIWIVHRPATLTNGEASAAKNPDLSVCCRPAPPVIEFDQAGNIVQAWGGPGEGYEWPLPDDKEPPNSWTSRTAIGEHTIFIDRDDVWLGSNGAKGTHILKFSRTGKFQLQIGRRGETHGSNDTRNLAGPAGLEVDPKTGEVFVADGYVNRRVIVFDGATGAYKRHWGAYGKPPDDTVSREATGGGAPPSQFTVVHCVRMSRDGLLYVCDRSNRRIQVFRKDGTFVREKMLPNVMPNDLAVSPDGEQQHLYVLDGRAKVHILRRSDLQEVSSFGHAGHFAGGFTMPHSMAVDSKGSIYVGESLEGKRVQRFVPAR